MKIQNFKVNDWCFCDYTLSKVLKVKDGVPHELTTGYIRKSGDFDGRCYHLSIETLHASDSARIMNLIKKILLFERFHRDKIRALDGMIDLTIAATELIKIQQRINETLNKNDMKNYFMIDGTKIPISDETAKEIKKKFKDERIPCPIKMATYLSSKSGDSIFIPFNNTKQFLLFNTDDNVYEVYGDYESTIRKDVDCDLIPIRREDLKAGDTAYRSDKKEPDFDLQAQYCKILNHSEYAWVWRNGISVDGDDFNYWWKVIPRK